MYEARLTLLAAAMAILSPWSAAHSAAGGTIPNGIYTIEARSGNQCWNVWGARTDPGAPIGTWWCVHERWATNEQFQFQWAGHDDGSLPGHLKGDLYYIRPVHDLLCVGGPEFGPAVYQQSCPTDWHRYLVLWYVRRQGDCNGEHGGCGPMGLEFRPYSNWQKGVIAGTDPWTPEEGLAVVSPWGGTHSVLKWDVYDLDRRPQ